MDLRTKLVFSLVAVALLSMLALGTLAYRSAEEPLTRRTLRQLEALSQVQESKLRAVATGWQEHMRLVASRTQLRRSLAALEAADDAAERTRIEEILEDAVAGSRSIQHLSVYDRGGRFVAATSRSDERSPPASVDAGAQTGVRLLGIDDNGDGSTSAFLSAPLDLEGETVGWLRAELSTGAFDDLTSDYTGLGDTGETMIVVRGRNGSGRVLGPVRHADEIAAGASGSGAGPAGGADGTGASAGGTTSPTLAPGTAASLALRDEEGLFTEGVVDYRGEAVWAAVRLLPDLGLGLVVKFDEDEELAPLREFRERLMRVGFSLSALAILAGVLLGLHFTRPIHDLVAVANRIGDGELDARADLEREDELGVLAGAFNAMGDELEERLTLLQEFKRLFDHSRDMLCIAGTDGYFKRVNPAFERNLGWSEQELLQRPFLDFVHPDDIEKTIAETERLGRGLPTISFENRYLLPDGEYARLHWTCHPELDTGELYASARIVGRDAETS